MKHTKAISVIMTICLILGNQYLFAQKAEELLSEAIQLEEVKGELEEAIKTYKLIVSQYPDNERVCAEALLHTGSFYEKLGKTEAIKSYELILERYPEQKAQAEAARARLAELKKAEPGEFRAEKMDFKITEPFGLSPDGTKVVGMEFLKGQNVVVSFLNKDKIDFITNFEWGNEFYWTYNPVWSPDGKEIVYSAFYAGTNEEGANSLSVSDLNGQSRILLSSTHEWYAPSDWMRDGSSILTFKGDTAGTLELGLVPASGEGFMKLVALHGPVQNQGSDRAAASFSPDGRFVVFTDIIPGEESDLYVMTSDGKSVWSMGSHPAADKWPRWSPDGKHIIFLSNRHGSWALWGVEVDNGKPAGDPFLIREGMGNSSIGNWTEHGLFCQNFVSIRDIFLLDVDPDTGEPRGKQVQLKYMPSGNNTHLAFAPHDNRLAFIREDDDIEKAYLVVFRNDEESHIETEIPDGYNPRFNNPRSIRWKPDGSAIGIYRGNGVDDFGIEIYHLNTQKWESISLPFPLWTYEWSDEEHKFYFERNGLYVIGAGIFEYSPETGEEKYIYRPETRNIVTFNELRCSRDRSKLAFLESTLSETNTSVRAQVVVDLNSGDSHIVADFGTPSWSPDGQKIMSIGADSQDDKRQTFTVFSADGDILGQYDLSKDLPKDSKIRRLDWSADGSQIGLILQHNIIEDLLYKNIIPPDKE